MIDETQQDQAALHALEMLRDEEAAAFKMALTKEPELQAMTDEMADAAAAIALALPAAKAPAEILPRLLAQIRVERMHAPTARTSGGNWMPWALAAGIAIAATVGFLAGEKIAAVKSEEKITRLNSQIDQTDTERQRLATMIAALKDERASLEKRVSDLRQRDALSQLTIATLKIQATTFAKAYAKVAAYVVWDSTGQNGVMRFDNLPTTAADKDYQMWIIDPRYDAPVSAGIFSAGSGGEFGVKFKPARPIAMAGKFAVSVEQKGGSTRPLGPIVLMSN